jgi:hypothetical protein
MGDVIPIDGGLFEMPARVPKPPKPKDWRSRAQRRRDRQAAAIELGQHPLSVALGTSIPLHPTEQAARETGADVVGPTCGDCALRRSISGGNKSFPKCTAHPIPRHRVDDAGKRWEWNDYPRATHGDGTDVAAWWPACTDYQPKDPDPTEENR